MTAAAAAKSLQSCLTLCDPIDGSPPGSPYPWDSPGKNTGVGCHFLHQCVKVKSERVRVSLSAYLCVSWTVAPPSLQLLLSSVATSMPTTPNPSFSFSSPSSGSHPLCSALISWPFLSAHQPELVSYVSQKQAPITEEILCS